MMGIVDLIRFLYAVYVGMIRPPKKRLIDLLVGRFGWFLFT